MGNTRQEPGLIKLSSWRWSLPLHPDRLTRSVDSKAGSEGPALLGTAEAALLTAHGRGTAPSAVAVLWLLHESLGRLHDLSFPLDPAQRWDLLSKGVLESCWGILLLKCNLTALHAHLRKTRLYSNGLWGQAALLITVSQKSIRRNLNALGSNQGWWQGALTLHR